MEPREDEPWPVGRDSHAACCLGYAGDHIHLLVISGRGRDDKTLRDVWLFDLSLKKWKEVRAIMLVTNIALCHKRFGLVHTRNVLSFLFCCFWYSCMSKFPTRPSSDLLPFQERFVYIWDSDFCTPVHAWF